MRNTDERAMPEDDGRINGVNLGGWLVLERWMTPGLFRASGEEDEIWLHRSTDPAELERLLRRHRDTYITEDDFRAISAHGLNLVRIPVPFFIFGDVPGHPGCVEYLDRAFDWAERAGLKVLIDLHTVPGSQRVRQWRPDRRGPLAYDAAAGCVRTGRARASRATLPRPPCVVRHRSAQRAGRPSHLSHVAVELPGEGSGGGAGERPRSDALPQTVLSGGIPMAAPGAGRRAGHRVP